MDGDGNLVKNGRIDKESVEESYTCAWVETETLTKTVELIESVEGS